MCAQQGIRGLVKTTSSIGSDFIKSQKQGADLLAKCYELMRIYNKATQNI